MTVPLVRPTVVNHPHGYRLPEELPETPVDEVTGLPWCFAPNPHLPPVLLSANYGQKAEWQHQFPKVEVMNGGNPVLEGLGRRALVGLRWQWVDYRDHHYGYNPHFIGPKQPATHAQLATTLIMGMAGDVPEFALDFTSSKPKDRKLTGEQRRVLWESGQLRVASPVDVSKFLLEYVFQQGVDHIREVELEEFLHTFDYDRRIYLGHCLAAKIVERAVEPVEGVYATARKNQRLFANAPANPRDFVKAHLTTGKRFGTVFSALQQKLGAHNRGLRELSASVD